MVGASLPWQPSRIGGRPGLESDAAARGRKKMECEPVIDYDLNCIKRSAVVGSLRLEGRLPFS